MKDTMRSVMLYGEQSGQFLQDGGMNGVWGHTLENTYIIVIYEEVDAETMRVVTAYDVPETH